MSEAGDRKRGLTEAEQRRIAERALAKAKADEEVFWAGKRALVEERNALRTQLHAAQEEHEQERALREKAIARLDEVLTENERLRKDLLSALPKCSTDATDFQSAKLEAAAWRLLARDVWAVLLDFRSQVLRYTVPPDHRYITALNRIDKLITDHATALTAPAPPRRGLTETEARKIVNADIWSAPPQGSKPCPVEGCYVVLPHGHRTPPEHPAPGKREK